MRAPRLSVRRRAIQQPERVERRMAEVDEDAQGEHRRAVHVVLAVDEDALAVDEDALAAVQVLRREGDPALAIGMIDPAHVLGRQVKRRGAVTPQQPLAVDILGAQVDDGACAILPGQALRLPL
jgi:hypothetical protein